MSNLPERPRVRPGLAAGADGDRPGHFVVWDQLRISPQPQSLRRVELEMLKCMDGGHTLRDLQMAAMRYAEKYDRLLFEHLKAR